MTNLLPCPHCGGEYNAKDPIPVIEASATEGCCGDYCTVRCNECGVSGPITEMMETAISDWNSLPRRAAATDTAAGGQTPRTDALRLKHYSQEPAIHAHYFETINHARQLERELAEAQRQRDEALEVLRELWLEQNGAPSTRDKEYWEAAMKKTESILNKHNP